MLTNASVATIGTCNPSVGPFLYIVTREEQFDKRVSVHVQVKNLERSGKTALCRKDKDSGS